MRKNKVDVIVETVLPGIEDDLNAELRSCRLRGVTVSRLEAIRQLEDLALSPEKVKERTQETRKHGLPHGLLEQVWRECFRRLRERVGH